MKQVLLQGKFPIFKLEVDKSEMQYKSAQALVDHFNQRFPGINYFRKER